jgi:acetyl esterase
VRDFATDPELDPQVIAFHKLLNTGGPRLEMLLPLEARKVLTDAQAAAAVDLARIEFSKKLMSGKVTRFLLGTSSLESTEL